MPGGRVVGGIRDDRVVVGGPVSTAVYEASSGRLMVHRYAAPVPSTREDVLVLSSGSEATVWDLETGDQLDRWVQEGEALALVAEGVVEHLADVGIMVSRPDDGSWQLGIPEAELAAAGDLVYLHYPPGSDPNGSVLTAWDPETIRPVWSSRAGGPVTSAALSTSGVLVAEHVDEGLVGYEAATGERLWASSFASRLRPSIVATDTILADVVVAGDEAEQAGLARIDPQTGRAMWTVPLGVPPGDAAAQRVLVAGEVVAGTGPDGWFVASGDGGRRVVATGDAQAGRVVSLSPLVVTDGRRVFGLLTR